MKSIAVCTIIAKNYLALAKTLADSFHFFHPTIDFRTLVVDPFNPSIDANEAGKMILDSPADFIDASLLNNLAYSYDITEFSTAAKPFYLEHLLQQGYEKIIYLDPDILILQPLDEIFQRLDSCNILLIPHLLDPIPLDGCLPTEISILQSGAYNLGFIGISQNQETSRFISWWKERLKKYCCVAPEKGLFVDQKWVDLVPGIFEKVSLFTKRGYNVAYWNLHARHVSEENGIYIVDGEPLVFFHFSGFNAATPDRLSKHQTRLKVEKLSPLAKLLQRYADLLKANNHDTYQQWSYGYGTFNNSVPLDRIGRDILRNLQQRGKKFPNPHDVNSKPSFFEWLNSPVEGSKANEKGIAITNYLYSLYQKRQDLQAAFPDVFGKHGEDYLAWITKEGVKQDIHPAYIKAAFKAGSQGNETTSSEALFGVNVAGYLTAASGVGQAARGYIEALKTCQSAIALLDFSSQTCSHQEDLDLGEMSAFNPYPVNLICINADQIFPFVNSVGTGYFEQKYNIGLWAWELPDFPSEWWSHFAYFNEIWVGSNFMYESIVKHSPIPVVSVPHVVKVERDRDYSKADFDLCEEEFTFLFSFDFLSVFQRKNPLAVVEAFKKAFQPDEPVRLVLKCIGGERDLENLGILKDAIAQHRITLFDRYLSREEKYGLLGACDCYASLHRSEGFGLTIAEAMYLEKPVIATGWSGNMDFMTVNNSYPVEYELKELQEDYGPYKKGETWAEPNIDRAAQLMRQVYEQPTEARQKAQRAAQDIRLTNSPDAIASIVKKRLDLIGRTRVEIQGVQMQPLLAELKRAQERIAAMETSKFWQLRTRWFKFKRRVGLKADNE
jgi:glycosyltransferase involved in cell wall biosynthesis